MIEQNFIANQICGASEGDKLNFIICMRDTQLRIEFTKYHN